MDSNGNEHFDSGDRGTGSDGSGGNGSARRLRRALSYFIVPYCFVATVWTFAVDYLGHPVSGETRNVMLGILAALLGMFIYRQWKRE